MVPRYAGLASVAAKSSALMSWSSSPECALSRVRARDRARARARVRARAIGLGLGDPNPNYPN